MKNNNLTKNTFYSIIKSCSAIIFPLITFPYISRVLLTENLGKINFGSSIVSYFSLIASLGIATYAVRECSYVKEDKNKLEILTSEVLSINIFTTLVSYILLFITLAFFSKLENYRLLIIIQSSAILFTTLGAEWLNIAMGDFKFITLRTFFFQLLSIILMFILVKEPSDYLKYVVITLVSSSGGNVVNVVYRRKYCKPRLVLNMNIKKHLPPIVTLFAMMLAQQIFVNSDTTIIGFIKGDYQVGLYSVSVKIYTIVNTFMSSIAWVVMPKLSASFSKKDYKEINSILKYVIGFIGTLGIPLVSGMFMLAPEIIEFIAGPEYISAANSLRILSISLFFSLAWGIVMNMILIPDGKDSICLKACTISAIMNIVLNFIFIPYFGFPAAAVTTTLSQILGLIICYPNINKSVQLYISNKFIFGVLLGSISIVFVVMQCKFLFNNSLVVLAISIAVSILVYFGIQLVFKNYWINEIIKSILLTLKSKRRKEN